MEPGVYIMRDQQDRVIYVGKAKKLKNRVSQYFVDTVSHSPKTKLMVSKIHHFDVIVASSEFEALILECSLIKQHMPKYNILLKDDKGFPYVRLDMREQYPVITMVNTPLNDGADYYGPYGSRGATQNLLDAIRLTLKLPACKKHFPRDIGKGRPCLNYHMEHCRGWCQAHKTQGEYRELILTAKQLLLGNFKAVSDDLRQQMIKAADCLNFELAASLRDRLKGIETLKQQQFVTAGAAMDTDVIGFSQTESVACFTILHYGGGNLLDKEYETFPSVDDPVRALSSLLKQYYFNKQFAPKRILLPFSIEDQELFPQVLQERFSVKTKLMVPRRGDNVRLIEIANKNALQEAERITSKEDRYSATLQTLAAMLGISRPARIEAFDISNISGTDIVASMVVFRDGQPAKGAYKRFKINDLTEQDDLLSMRQVITRRFERLVHGDTGFDEVPDLLLIDGGVNHAQTAHAVLQELKLDVPVFGMVKDDRHRTRALVTPDGAEVRIDAQQSVFTMIGRIQEEAHRFAITYHRSIRSKRLKYSELDGIVGIGPKRKQALLKKFHSISGIREATLAELGRVLPKDAASAVYQHFHIQKEV